MTSNLPPLVEALLDPRIYPHSPAKVELVQTQMSFIFLTGDYVYKVKKPVDLGYLDYTTLEKRRFFCQQEVVLNQRLCPEIYLEVVPLMHSRGKFSLSGKGDIVEYAVKMRQLPRDKMMDALLRQKQVSPEMVQRVAYKLAEFHKRAETNEEISQFGGLNTILTNTEENFRQTQKYIGVSLSSEHYQGIKSYTDYFVRGKASLFDQRVTEGRIRDCHGDLHAAHICFANGIYIYDCIEFNARFRYCDVASEIAFLAMDLDFWGCPHLSQSFVSAYVDSSQDRALLKLLDFYKCYRAYVRGKVESFKLDDPHISVEEKVKVRQNAQRYFGLAYSYTLDIPHPILFITTGLVGTGKTALAQALAQKLGLEVISSDVVRKKLANVPPTEHRFEEFDQGIYSPGFTRRTYDQMFAAARRILSRGQSVILDASFGKRAERLRARELAREMNASFWVIECVLNEDVARQRLEQRLKEGSVSDGRWEVWERQRREFDEANEIPGENHIVMDSSQPVEEIAGQILHLVKARK